MLKQSNILYPQYVKDFSCIGQKCEDTCCKGWVIDIDKSTYKKYKLLNRKHELKATLDKNIIRNRKSKIDSFYAKVKLKENGNCPLLDKENLCSVQKQLGEDYLSSTCKVYPRSINRVDDRVEVSLSMSCPEAARLGLLKSNLMIFDEKEDVEEINKLARRKVTTVGKKEDNINFYFWDLRVFSIGLMQNRNYSISERLILLGMFYNKLQTLIVKGDFNKIPNLINDTNENIIQKNDKEGFKKIPTSIEIQVNLTKSILEAKLGITNERFLKCLEELRVGLNNSEVVGEDTKIIKSYQENFTNFYQPFMEDNEYIIENYLVNYIYKELFPLNQGLEVFKAYSLLTVHFSIIKLILIGVSGYHEGLSEEIVIRVIQSYSRTIEHNGIFLRKVLKELEEKGYLSMGYMAILLKN
ncbi:flagellin lysine-N-methylase [Halalkalibacter akibai]|uniref:Lysine-N-methylase n=1 Tax=Halalkalibacter akibai (strain ATCC 43226 / DSM 21942 / CIP 109018 / JCM 9157 / 1139) TaxID=1236973 RepID=W4QMB5_HALA3|nr:flagellin lysine-N-methylase [Halalkalibacter akibai]GAE33037.1 hypothetical protein JCM9157_21 [Halalkalibacter akibai JCM 9157]